MNEMTLEWTDLRLFLSVARLGGLRGAALAAGVSAPTLGRRMAALEQQIGQQLFVRSPAGYALTAAGDELLKRVQDVEVAMRGIASWAEGTSADPLVRISAGLWMLELLAGTVGELWQVEDHIRLEFISTFENLDVLRRAADIDFRQEPPVEPGLAQKSAGRIAYAIYSGRKRVNGIEAGYFVGFAGAAAALAPARWLDAHHGDRIGLRGNDVHSCVSMVAAGGGLSVFPCFVGDSDPRLIRLGSIIPELTHDIWLVAHDDRRHDKPVRLVFDRLTTLLQRLAPLLRGEQPKAWETPRS